MDRRSSIYRSDGICLPSGSWIGRTCPASKNNLTNKNRKLSSMGSHKRLGPYPTGPGKFTISIDSDTLPTVLGQDGNSSWHWVYAGVSMIKQPEITLSINDLSGFEGRVDAIYLTQKNNDQPPTSKDTLELFRRKMLHLPKDPKEAGTYDLVIAGGGVAGTCAAIQAARLGLKVALIQNRPVLGGNNSSEIRLPMSGDIYHNLYPKLGRIRGN